MSTPLNVGVGWSTDFERPGLQRLLYRRLRYAYRAPSFFAGLMLRGGCVVKFLRFDESLQLPDLDGTSGRITEDVDLLYIATHGECPNSGYRVALREKDWAPCANGFGNSGPSVAVFDTCDLVNLRDPQWHKPWVSCLGLSVRLLLGFGSPATAAYCTTRRGHAFAGRILSGAPIGPSWLEVAHSTIYAGLDLAVAVGLGDTQRDAEWALRRMTLKDLPARRENSLPSFDVEASR